jgi:hypothetical protein
MTTHIDERTRDTTSGGLRGTVSRGLRGGLVLLLGGIGLQVALAGAGAFGAPAWRMHMIFGSTLVLVAGALLVAALWAHAPRRLKLGTSAVFLLTLVQPLSAVLAERLSPWFGLLHASVAALLLAVLAVLLVGGRSAAGALASRRAAG